MKATICDVCKTITTKPEPVKYSIGKRKGKAELCESCARKLTGFFENGAIHTDAPKPKTQPVKTDSPAIRPQPAPEKPKQPIKALKDIGLALAPATPTVAIGFLYIKCPVCGEVKGFNAKQEISHFHCGACNSDSELTSLVDLYSRCECGRTWHYVTNMTDEMFDIPCLDCGTPIPVGFNAKSGAYETIRQNTRR